MASLIKTKPLTETIKAELSKERSSLGKLVFTSLVFSPAAATGVYIAAQKRWADMLDVEYRLITCNSAMSAAAVKKIIAEQNADPDVKGIILHRPFPQHWDEVDLSSCVDFQKDIEGISPQNLGALALRKALFIPPTAGSVVECLSLIDFDIYGKDVVIVGYSAILGKPLSILLADRLATVTIAQVGTFEAGRLPFFVSSADVLISAVGRAHLIKGDWIKSGAVVIDVGISVKDDVITGDVEFDAACKRASFITPVPGGVGSLTVALLFKNLFYAAKNSRR